MFEKVQEIFAKQLRIAKEKITLEARLQEDLGADSISLMQLLMTIEDDYGVVIPDESLANFKTVGDIVTYLDNNK